MNSEVKEIARTLNENPVIFEIMKMVIDLNPDEVRRIAFQLRENSKQ